MTEEFTERNAVITSATLSSADHGVLSSFVNLDYGGQGQGFGGYALYLPKDCDNHRIMSVAGHFIWRVMEVAGVSEWTQLRGRTVRVRQNHGSVHAIGHIVNNDWFVPSEDFREEPT